jgi:hypothetical protein
MLQVTPLQARISAPKQPWRPKVPSPAWRSFLRNHMRDISLDNGLEFRKPVPEAIF